MIVVRYIRYRHIICNNPCNSDGTTVLGYGLVMIDGFGMGYGLGRGAVNSESKEYMLGCMIRGMLIPLEASIDNVHT